MTLSGELLIGLLAGIALAVLALFFIKGRALLPAKTASKSQAPDARLEQLATRVGMLEKQLQLTRTDLEEALKHNADSLRADIKLIQMQAQSARSAAETDVVKVHRYHPSRQGMIEDAVAPAPRDPTAPAKISKFAKVVASPPVVIICAKLFVFQRK